ncbi:hypothetical protein PGT21_032960 [Puccinia graminis f. sp. tritici]|uniref:Uncharacterized protein n=1 Tax=Puccinia graminis f. sp. tritici TaxID=56615 RepID=A0A5B0S6M1_PUCGR|nr:hypothetical protein PGT21_032960 [Puccinia graminis f. sp. tritici]KAA1132254.1 hypothetical protein PGTUg99_002261 [Puccinia graminis f. sp. tritici]
MEQLDLLSSLETGYRSRLRRTQLRNHHQSLRLPTAEQQLPAPPITPISASLTRRLLAVASSAANNLADTNLTAGSSADGRSTHNWRHTFFERMNQDVQSGVGRLQAVNRLRQRMAELRPTATATASNTNNNPTADHQPDSYSTEISPHHPKISNQRTYLLYCGNKYQLNGCGKLISVRAAVILPKSFRSWMDDQQEEEQEQEQQEEGEEHRNGNPTDFNLVTSDTLPFPNSADRVDRFTQQSFENDPANPFHRSHSIHPACVCQKDYLGCLSCGNIVGHSVSLPCDQCRDLAVFHPQFYYLSRLTAVPRYTDVPIGLELAEGERLTRGLSEGIMSWTEAVRRKKKDLEAGLAQAPLRGDLAPSIGPSQAAGLSTRIREAILLGSLVDEDHPSNLLAIPPSSSTPSPHQPPSPAPTHPLSSRLDRLRRTPLARRPAVRLSTNLTNPPSELNNTLPTNLRSRASSSSESWVVRETPRSERFPEEFLRLPHEDLSTTPSIENLRNDIEVKEEEDDDEDGQPSSIDSRLRTTNHDHQLESNSRAIRRPHSELDNHPNLPSDPASVPPAFGRVIRRRINPSSELPSSSSSSSSGIDFFWVGDVCAR